MNALDPTAIGVILGFIALALLLEAFFDGVYASRKNRNVNRRLGLIARGRTRNERLALLRPAIAERSDGGVLGDFMDWLAKRLAQAGMRIGPRRVLGTMIAVSLTIGLLFPTIAQVTGRFTSTGAILLLIAFALVVGMVLPLVIIDARAAARLRKFEAQFPVALDIFVRGLRAGYPVQAAMDLLTTEMQDPCGSEFGIVVDEVNYGLDLRDALDNLRDRLDSPDLHMFVVSMAIQRETGGALADILDGLSRVIRERNSLYMKVKALSAEGRMTGVMLTVMPLLTFAFVFSTHPEFYLKSADDALFVPGIVILLMLYGAGVVMIKRMVALKV